MKTDDVRVISRGIIADGNFGVVHKELSAEGRIELVLRDKLQRVVTLSIRPEVLEDVEAAGAASAEIVVEAENRVLARHAL